MTSVKREKAQLHIPNNIYLKFQVKTPSGYEETVPTRFD